MSIQQIGSDQVPPGLAVPGGRFDALASRGAPEKKGTSSNGDAVDQEIIAPQTATFNRAMILHERDNAAAKQVRMSDEAMKAVGNTLDQMSQHLEVIVKNYPPFPPGSEERVQRLRSYAGLRDMIDRLTIPPNEGARTLMAEKKTEASTAVLDQWVVSIDSNGKTRTVRKEDVPTGPSGLNVPRLDPPERIDDHAIVDALDKLGAAKRLVDEKRDQLRIETLAVPHAAAQASDVIPQETSALDTSAVVRDDLARRPVSIASGGFSQLEQLLG